MSARCARKKRPTYEVLGMIRFDLKQHILKENLTISALPKWNLSAEASMIYNFARNIKVLRCITNLNEGKLCAYWLSRIAYAAHVAVAL